ncbi:hypothetical protein VPHD478_0016 [Vibrio phage D478]
MAVAMIGPKFYAWDRNGKPLAFGKLYTYEARTNVPKPTYQSEDQVVENTNPVILNGEGYANIYLSGSYKMVLKDEKENEIWSSDPVSSNSAEEWVNCVTASYLSPTSFKLVGNFTDAYTKGRKVRLDSNSSSYSYGTIDSSSYSAGETTVIVNESIVTTGLVFSCVSIVGPESSFNYSDLGKSSEYQAESVEDMLLGVLVGGDSVELSVGQKWCSGSTRWTVESISNPVLISDFKPNGDVWLSDFNVNGDGSDTDKQSVIEAISIASNGHLLHFDVEGVFNPVSLVNGSNIHVEKDMTLKGNPETTPQGIQDCLWNIIGVNGFRLTWHPDVEMFSESHGAYQEFSHAVRCRDESSDGYIGKHKSNTFDGDGLYLFNLKNVTVDEPYAYQPGRNGISITGKLENVVINQPYCEGINPTTGAINLSAIDLEPNAADVMDLVINSPSGYGDNARAAGFIAYMERNQYNALDQYFHVVVDNPRYSNFRRNYDISRTFWDLTTEKAVRGSITLDNPTSINHLDNAFYFESVMAKGGIEVNVNNPSVVITHSLSPGSRNDDGRVVCVTRNQSGWDDTDRNPVITMTNLSINDIGVSGHDCYIFARYSRYINKLTIDKLVKVQSAIDLIQLPESGRGTTAIGVISKNAKSQKSLTSDYTITVSDIVYDITNDGATTDINLTLPLIPFNCEITIINMALGMTINVIAPSGMSIGSTGSPYPMDAPYQQITFKRVNADRYVPLI